MKLTLSNKAQVEIASALFGAQNAIGYLRGLVDGETSVDLDIERAEEKIKAAIKLLGGVDYLSELGA